MTVGADRGAPQGYDYGNARLRVLKQELFDAAFYQRLLIRDVEGLMTALAETPYRPDVEAALARSRGLDALHRAASTNLTRVLRTVTGFYAGRAAWALALILSRFDVQNVLTILRAQARRVPTADTLPLLVPVGAIDEVSAGEMVRQPNLPAAVGLMAEWGVPRPDVARAVWGQLPAYEATGDLSLLETALMRAHAAGLARALAQEADEVSDLEPVMREELDRRNLLVSLRLRDARGRGEPTEGPENPYLPGGRIPAASFAGLAGTDTPDDVLGRLSRLDAPSHWQRPVATWATTGNLSRLEHDLDAEATRRAISLFWRGDPLGVGVPTAFVAAKENEVRNLRLLAYGADQKIPPDEVSETLVIPW
jgi:V/A-type H+-transporting ATPase subunit C